MKQIGELTIRDWILRIAATVFHSVEPNCKWGATFDGLRQVQKTQAIRIFGLTERIAEQATRM